jgi:uncharacterized protein YneF (UPF0154 family)
MQPHTQNQPAASPATAINAAKKPDSNVKAIQDLLKKNGVKMSAIEIRELMRTGGLTPDENRIKAYVRQLRQGF